jgi:PAS domain S-box-containing protein
MASAGQSAEQLRQRQDVDAIPTLAWSARPDGSAEFLTRRWLEYTGLSAEEASDWGWTAAVHTEDRDRLMDFWRHLLASGEAGEIEARLRRHDGDYRWFLFRVEPARDNHGHIFKWYGANTDIEDRKRAEALLAAEKRTLEMIASGACLPDILEKLCETVDAQASNVKSAVMQKPVFPGAATLAHPRRRLEHHCHLLHRVARSSWEAWFGQPFDPSLRLNQRSIRNSGQKLGCHSWA